MKPGRMLKGSFGVNVCVGVGGSDVIDSSDRDLFSSGRVPRPQRVTEWLQGPSAV